MKDSLIYSTIIAMVLFSGCEGSKSGSGTAYPSLPRPVTRSKQITLVVDTQPSGAVIYHQAEEGVWMKSQSTTPLRFVLDVEKTTNRPPKLTKVNERPLQEYEGASSGRPHLGCGLFYVKTGRDRYISIDNMQFLKDGYEPCSPKKHLNLYALLSYIGEEYKIIFPLKAEEVTKP